MFGDVSWDLPKMAFSGLLSLLWWRGVLWYRSPTFRRLFGTFVSASEVFSLQIQSPSENGNGTLNTMPLGDDWSHQSSDNMTGCIGNLIFNHKFKYIFISIYRELNQKTIFAPICDKLFPVFPGTLWKDRGAEIHCLRGRTFLWILGPQCNEI